jgi:hypothetical protein
MLSLFRLNLISLPDSEIIPDDPMKNDVFSLTKSCLPIILKNVQKSALSYFVPCISFRYLNKKVFLLCFY